MRSFRLIGIGERRCKIGIVSSIGLGNDTNIIASDIENTSCWGINSLYGDDYYIPNEKDPMLYRKENEIYTMEIYMDYGMIYYKRTCNKIFTILSKVFSLFKFTCI